MPVDPLNIERTYWDFLCADHNAWWMYEVHLNNWYTSLYNTPDLPKLSECEIIYFPTPIPDTAKCFSHLAYYGSNNWCDKMLANGFNVRSLGSI